MRNQAMTLRLEQAMRFAAQSHAGQLRKSSETPYFEHVAAVALILDRAGFPEDVVIAGLLHDVVEDTAVTFEQVASLFGDASQNSSAIAPRSRPTRAGTNDSGSTASETTLPPWLEHPRMHERSCWPISSIT